MPRITPTHELSASGEGPVPCDGDGDCPGNTTCGPDGYCVDDYDERITGPSDKIGGDAGDPVPVRFHPQGANIDAALIRTETGESVQRSPIVEGPGHLAAYLSAGDTLALAPLTDGFDDYADLEARAVSEIYGPQRSRPAKTLIETEEM